MTKLNFFGRRIFDGVIGKCQKTCAVCLVRGGFEVPFSMYYIRVLPRNFSQDSAGAHRADGHDRHPRMTRRGLYKTKSKPHILGESIGRIIVLIQVRVSLPVRKQPDQE